MVRVEPVGPSKVTRPAAVGIARRPRRGGDREALETSGCGLRSTAISARQSSVWRNIRPLRKSRYCSRRIGSSTASSSSRDRLGQHAGLHLEEVGLREVLQPVARGMGRELVEVDRLVDRGELVVEERLVASLEQTLGLARA